MSPHFKQATLGGDEWVRLPQRGAPPGTSRLALSSTLFWALPAESGSKGRRLHRVSPALPPSRPARPAGGRGWVASNCAPCPDGGPGRRKFRSRRGGRGGRERGFVAQVRGASAALRGFPSSSPRGNGRGKQGAGQVPSHTPGQVKRSPVPLFFPQVSPRCAPPAFRTARRQQQAAGLGTGRCRGPQPRGRSLPFVGCRVGRGSPTGGQDGSVPSSARRWDTVPGLGGSRDARCHLSVPLQGGSGCVIGRGMRGRGAAGGAGLAPALLAAGERKPAASSAVPGTRALLLLSAAAALLLRPIIIIRGGCEKEEKKKKLNTKNNTPKQTTKVPPPPTVSGTSRTGCASLTLGRGGRAGEAGGRRGPGPGRHRENRFCLRHGERRRGSVLRLPEPPAHRPLRSRRHRGGAAGLRGSAPGSGQLAGFSSFFISPPLLLVLFLPFRRRGSPTLTHAVSPPEVSFESSRNPRRSWGFSHPSWGL